MVATGITFSTVHCLVLWMQTVASFLSNVIVQGYNEFTGPNGDYEIQWRNLQAGPGGQLQIPEPGSIALVGIGVMVLLATRRKKLSNT